MRFTSASAEFASYSLFSTCYPFFYLFFIVTFFLRSVNGFYIILFDSVGLCCQTYDIITPVGGDVLDDP